MVQYLTIEQRRHIFDLYKTNPARRVVQLFNEENPNRPPIVHSTVSKIVAKFSETGSLHDRHRSGRPSKRRDDEVAFNVLAQIVENPRISSRIVAANVDVSQKTVLNILHDHGFYPYKARVLHYMSQADKLPRLAFANEMRQMIDNDEDVVSRILFTDESLFVLKHAFNTQNSRYVPLQIPLTIPIICWKQK